MRTSTSAAFALTALLALGACDDKKAADGAGGAEASAPAAKKAKADDGKRFDNPKLLAIAKTQIEGFEAVEGMGAGKPMMGQIVYRYSTPKDDKGVKVDAQVISGACNAGACQELSLAAFEKRKDALPHTMMFTGGMKENPKLVHELAELDIDGKKTITAHVFSYSERKVGGGTSRSGTHRLIVYYHDGSNHLQIQMSVSGGSLSTEESFKGARSKDDLIAAAKKVFAAAIKHY